jgi:hypothetical protein
MNDVCKKIQTLPLDLVYIIKSYLTPNIFIFTNKQYYFECHLLLRKLIKNYEFFIREMIRRDNYFVFETILRENYNKFIEIKEFEYRNLVFKNYIYFLNHYCIENHSNNCSNVINVLNTQHGLGKNQHKKNIVKHIRWNN